MPPEMQRRAARRPGPLRHRLTRRCCFGCFGGLSPDKRIPEVLAALDDIVRYVPGAHLLLAGAPASHYDVAGDVRSRGLSSRTG